jgi:hypothetical protein
VLALRRAPDARSLSGVFGGQLHERWLRASRMSLGSLGLAEILLIVFIVVLIFGTSRLLVERDGPVGAAMEQWLSALGFGFVTTVLFGMGFILGEQVAAGLDADEYMGVFAVASIGCLVMALLGIVKARVPSAMLRFAPLLFLLAGLATGFAANRVLGPYPQESRLL